MIGTFCTFINELRLSSNYCMGIFCRMYACMLLFVWLVAVETNNALSPQPLQFTMTHPLSLGIRILFE